MIPKNKLKLDCVITISQRFLLKEVEVNSLENLFSKDFFTFENLENLKQDSVTLPTEVVINCVELKSNNSKFIEVADKFLNLSFCSEFYFDSQLGELTFKDIYDVTYLLDSKQVLSDLESQKLNFLPCGILEDMRNFLNL